MKVDNEVKGKLSGHTVVKTPSPISAGNFGRSVNGGKANYGQKDNLSRSSKQFPLNGK